MADVTVTWLETTAEKVAKAFAGMWIAQAIAAGGGLFNAGTLRQVTQAAILAGLAALDSILGNIITPGSTSTVPAIKARLNQSAS
jgi:hypothetical protein